MTKTPPNTPQVQVEFETPYVKGTQKLDIQSNRIDPREQFAWQWLTWLYPPASPADFALDAATYVIAAGLVASIGSHLLSLLLQPVAVALLLAGLTALILLCWLVIVEVKRGWLLLLYRSVLLLIGTVLGGVL
jgi:hypothetical protein